ncbi:MAG: C10 family peptidase [Syntrophales bacterium]|nr:C10 family peptidase [Syntrophales bacterium]
MKFRSGILALGVALCLVAAVLFSTTGAWARPTTPEQARLAVLNWLGLDAAPLGAPLGQQIKEVQTFSYEGAPAYFVVYLNPSGLVFLPADDLVEPIIGFLPEGVYDPSPANPLGALVSQDIPGRVLQAQALEAKGIEALAPESPQSKAQRKWDLLTQPIAPKASELAPPDSINDVRVAPFVESRWSQTTVSDNACYNYYTPPNAAGSADNYPCGCVATAMAQLMRYWQHPANGIGQIYCTYYVTAGTPPVTTTYHAYTRGGDGSGGAYDWANMVLAPFSGVTETQRQAIGTLTYDAGLSVHMSYASGGSGADTLAAADAFTGTFGYTNAQKGYNSLNNLPETNRNAMVNANLHAKYPVLLGITGDGGHAIVCDGYGYDVGTMYHHLNMGWAGSQDAWYNLPTIDTAYYDFNSVYKCVYNVYPTGSGEIIAGRVTQADGVTPISGATVTATGGYATTTDANGIYALAQVPSNTTFTVSVSKTGYNFSPQSVTTGVSTNMTTTTGNQWPLDFAGSIRQSSLAPMLQLLLN